MEAIYVLDICVTVKSMSKLEIKRREKEEMQLEIDDNNDGGGDGGELPSHEVEQSQRTTHDIGQWTAPRSIVEKSAKRFYPDKLTSIEIEILGPVTKYKKKLSVISNYVGSHVVVGSILVPPTGTENRISFGKLRRLLLNKVIGLGAYQTERSNVVAGERSKIFIRPSRGSMEMQDLGTSTLSMWKYLNEKRTKSTSREIKVYLGIGHKYLDDTSVTMIEDDDEINLEDSLSQDLRTGKRHLNSPSKPPDLKTSKRCSREASQDVNEEVKLFLTKILGTRISPCYNSLSDEMYNHTKHHFEQKKFGLGMCKLIFNILISTNFN